MKQATRKIVSSKKHPNISGSKRTRETVVDDVPVTTTLKKKKKVTFVGQVLYTAEKTGQSSIVSTNPNDESSISKRVKHPRLYKKSCCRMLTAAVQPSIFSDLVDKFTNQQRKLVIEIGFGGLLMIHLKRIGRKMNSWLIECFNTESRMFVIGDLKEFVVSSNVVHDILALPRNSGNIVPKYPIYRKCDNDFSLAKNWWTRYIGVSNPSEGLTTSDVISKLSTIKDANDEFVKLFVLVAVCLFLAPISNKRVDLKIVKVLDSVEAIKSYDWCTFVLDKLCDGVKRCQKNVRNKHLSGCITVLQIAYIHHLEFRGVTAPTKIPLIQHWTTEQIAERITLELRSGGFGNGILVGNKYPICHERRCLNHLLASSPNIHVVSKDDLHEAMNLFQKDFDAIYDVHVKRLLSLKSKVEESFSSQNATAATTSLSPIISDSQDFFSSPEVLEYIDRVVDSIATVKKVTSDMPSFTLLTPSPPQQKEVEERGNGDKEDDEEGDDEESEDEDFDDEDLERSEDSDEENDREEENQEVEMAGDPNDGKSDDDDDSSDIGDLLLVSNFTRSNAKLFKSNLDPYLLDMVDFCLYEDPD